MNLTHSSERVTAFVASVVATISASLLFICCNEGSPARPALADATAIVAPPDDGAVAEVTSPGFKPRYAVCVDGIAPTFPSIFTMMFATGNCGAGSPYDCHSSTGALATAEGGTGSLLDFSLDASSVFEELLGDGGGLRAVNIKGDAGQPVLRVAPGEPDASLLYIKLVMPTDSDPRYGKAMPPTGLVCPATIEAVRAWIEDGASPF